MYLPQVILFRGQLWQPRQTDVRYPSDQSLILIELGSDLVVITDPQKFLQATRPGLLDLDALTLAQTPGIGVVGSDKYQPAQVVAATPNAPT